METKKAADTPKKPKPAARASAASKRRIKEDAATMTDSVKSAAASMKSAASAASDAVGRMADEAKAAVSPTKKNTRPRKVSLSTRVMKKMKSAAGGVASLAGSIVRKT